MPRTVVPHRSASLYHPPRHVGLQARAVLSEVRRRKSGGASSAAQPPHSQQNGTGPAGMGGTAHLRHRTHAPANGRATSARAEVSRGGDHTHACAPEQLCLLKRWSFHCLVQAVARPAHIYACFHTVARRAAEAELSLSNLYLAHTDSAVVHRDDYRPTIKTWSPQMWALCGELHGMA